MNRFLTFILSLFAITTFAQDNFFTNYKPLQAEGEMPDDFAKLTFEKVIDESHEQIEGLSKKRSEEFIKGIHYGIDEILKSGRVSYGDPISKYVSKVGEKIIGNNPELANIRFYTLRSNVVNAFSTKQGIIFVTEGLVAQVSNEAQLAFVIAHEIAHYLENHVIQGYKESIELAKNRTTHESKIKSLSTYSKEKEYEADGVGVDLYYKAGYSKEELLDVYDVLTYSYLPFDLKVIPKDYWNSEHLVIPETYFPEETPIISTEKDYDDSKSSHPNIKSRSEQVLDIVESMTGWKDNVYLVSEEEFLHVRNIARFESVRNDLYNFRYGDALYSIFLLEQDFPDNIYLNRCKAQAWAGLLAFKIDGRYSNITISPSKVQGDPHVLHNLIKKLSKKQLITVAFRQVVDIKNQFPEDEEVNAIYNYAIGQLAKESNFKLSDYSEMTYTQAYDEFQRSLAELNAQASDTTKVEEKEKETEEKELSKYEKIKRTQTNKTKAVTVDDKFNVEEFHIYALSDVVADENFKSKYNELKLKIKKKEEETENNRNLSYTERAKIRKTEKEEALMIGADEIILLEPRAMKVKGNNVDVEKSEELEIDLREVVERFSGNNKVSVYKVGTLEYKSHGTYMYNQKSVLVNSLSHLIEFENTQLFPVDYALNKAIVEDFGTGKVAFVFIQSVTNTMNVMKIVAYSIFPPVWLLGGPVSFMRGFYTNFGVVVFDLEKYEFDAFSSMSIAGITSKLEMEALLYDFLLQINQKGYKTK